MRIICFWMINDAKLELISTGFPELLLPYAITTPAEKSRTQTFQAAKNSIFVAAELQLEIYFRFSAAAHKK